MKQSERKQYQLIDVNQVSKYTGLSVSVLYKMVSQRRIPYVKTGRLVKFDLEGINEWIKQNTVMPMPNK